MTKHDSIGLLARLGFEAKLHGVASVVAGIRSKPGDPRNADLPEIEALAARTLRHARDGNMGAASVDLMALNDLLARSNARVIGPIVKTGCKQRAALRQTREQSNRARHELAAAAWREWNEAARPYWKPGVTKNAAARLVREKLKLGERISTIAKRLKKPRKAG